jgi:hypothetical protein
LYLEFSEYQSWGGKLSETEFGRAEYAARKKIDSMTSNRLIDEDPIRESVRRLVMELIERKYCGSLKGEDWTSVSNDGRGGSLESNKSKAEALIREYLGEEKTEEGILLINPGGIQFAGVKRV